MKNYHIVFWKEDLYWVAKCLENSIASQGTSLAEAKKNIKDALQLSLEDENEVVYNIKSVKTERLSLAMN